MNYDEYGNFNGFDTSKYVFEKNLQGDVIGIYNDLGRLVAQYRYDAWGNCIITQNVGGMATFNAIRYRGYYYDTETGLYYLKSRYYDPNTGRFINADTIFDDAVGIFGYNLYTYCVNNPVNKIDLSGRNAIYVSDYRNPEGVPVVGHAVLYFQDADGNWYKTEYAGDSKQNAKVYLKKVDKEMIDTHLSKDHVESVEIIGDFSACYDLAKSYEGSNYGGYNLIFNNCLHYVQEVLRVGEPVNPINRYVFFMPDNVPNSFLKKLEWSTKYDIYYLFLKLLLKK